MYEGKEGGWHEPFDVGEVADASTLARALRTLQCLGQPNPGQACSAERDDAVDALIERAGLHRNGSASNSLLSRARRCIQIHAGDETFSVERLALALHMSRASLHRKLVATVGVAPGDLIRHVRLEMARQMLCECEDSVSTVAYAVGFETLSGFSRAFTAHFGVCPSRCRRPAA